MHSERVIQVRQPRITDLEALPSFLLNHIVHKYNHIVHAQLRSTEVSTLQMRIIVTLHTYGRLTVSELCGYAIAEQPTMSRALDSLETQGLVRREMSDADSRLRLVSLTEGGVAAHARIRPVVIGINDAMTAGFDESQRATLLRQLGMLLTNLEQL